MGHIALGRDLPCTHKRWAPSQATALSPWASLRAKVIALQVDTVGLVRHDLQEIIPAPVLARLSQINGEKAIGQRRIFAETDKRLASAGRTFAAAGTAESSRGRSPGGSRPAPGAAARTPSSYRDRSPSSRRRNPAARWAVSAGLDTAGGTGPYPPADSSSMTLTNAWP